MMDTTEKINESRFAIRAHMGLTPIYTDSIEHVYDYLQDAIPGVDREHGALFLFAVGIFMLTAAECDTMCVHQAGANIAALADRMLIDHAWEQQLKS
ncbi:hypothetical protein HUO13_26110 [Saccharopolyspora erythraea]|uniref:hypothetical protein n=1 Tax=Saccharopolyspora erythraea TaxID=1836 RepID=UPI001BAA9011|nr:hypothetical protein [Saccharopolyspora erythraea]QUH03826.1 hypothetical protein HUO13_26110 [Saccharopolyspora erythraea]